MKPQPTARHPERARTWSIPSRRADMPERIGRYRLVRRVSRGGMAQVYEAFLEGEGGFARRFAVKVPLPDTELPELAAFADEARILSQLHHHGIVGVVDFGTHEGWPYQVLEYVDGPDVALLRALRGARGNFNSTLALLIVIEAARALHYVHEATDWQGRPLGIVHRDVSPHNILVSWAGDVKLIDFGIAMAEGRLMKTQDGIVKGKLLYMAPEQIGGQRVTPRTDVFSLGCVLYYLMTAESPYATDDDRSRAARNLRPTWLDSLEPDVSAIIEKAIALRPQHRQESALDFANACEQALARRPDASVSTLRRCLADLKTSMPDRPSRKPRGGASSVVVVGIEPDEEAPTLANLDLVSPTSAIPTSRSRAPVPDRKIGRFVLQAPLPFVEDAYEAQPTDPNDEARYAVRKLSCAKLAPDAIARRLADAARMSTVDHDHLLRVREFGVDGDDLYVAVDHPSGHSLRRVIRDAKRAGGLGFDELAALASGLIAAVRAAHTSARTAAPADTARDIRPETFLLTHDGFPKLMDTFIDGPRAGVRDPRVAEVRALVQLIERLPCAPGTVERMREAFELLRDIQTPGGLSQALLALRNSTEATLERTPNRILADLMLRLYEDESARAQSDLSREQHAPSAVHDTAIIDCPPFPDEGGDDERLITELDPDGFEEIPSYDFIAARYA